MDSSDLAFFEAVVQEGGVGKAAQRLHCVQSNVTARIRNLEQELQVQLFHRNGRGMILTREGQRLLPYARRISVLLAEAKAAVQDSPTPRGPLLIGSMETTAAVRLPPLLAAYHRDYPEVELSLATGPSATLITDVLDYRLDGAFVAGPILNTELEETLLSEEELVIIAAPSYPWPECLHHADKRLTVLAFRNGCSYREKMDALLRAEGVRNARMMEFGTLDGILGGVAAGIGIAMVPRAIVIGSRQADNLVIHPIGSALAKAPTMFIRRRDAFMTSAMARFIDRIAGGGSGELRKAG